MKKRSETEETGGRLGGNGRMREWRTEKITLNENDSKLFAIRMIGK